jgi:diguanylate cyclase (GGDEF)-like protein
MEFKSKHQFYRDPVTDLFNEDFFLTRLELAFERAKRLPNFHFGIIAIDVQLETQPEEQTRPDVTLAILREVAGRLKKFVRPTDAVARLAGWKFVTLFEDMNQSGEIQFIVKRLREKLAGPYEVDETSYDVKIELVPIVNAIQHKQPVDILTAAQTVMNALHSTG